MASGVESALQAVPGADPLLACTFRRIAVVNRGEAAMRLIRAVRELEGPGTRPRTIALFTDPDRDSLFVRMADESVCLGPAQSAGPSGQRVAAYLDEAALRRALEASRADAAWPGWGFAAQQPWLAELCERLGIAFVGPDAASMRRLGNRILSRKLAESLDIPVVPWSGGPVGSLPEALAAARALGYPVVVKAAAGGGGRGMRTARGPAELPRAFHFANHEALATFGDNTVLLERRPPHVRHLEVQVVADGRGTVWPLGVRECSLQRRHQRVLEEAPGAGLDARARAALEQAAVALTRAAGYRNAGTLEFLHDPASGALLFSEANTRLQVEHPATEATTGVDLVKLQLHVAAGGLLEGPPPATRGHAITVRLNAEDPGEDFAPSPGRLEILRLGAGPGVRVDSGYEQGDEVPDEFDSMLAKVTAFGRDRGEALARLRRALAESVVVLRGGQSNLAFLRDLVEHPDVRAGAVDVDWLDASALTGTHRTGPLAGIALAGAAIAEYEVRHAPELREPRLAAPGAGAAAGQVAELSLAGQAYSLVVRRAGPDRYRIGCDGETLEVTVDRRGGAEMTLAAGAARHRLVVVSTDVAHVVEVDGRAFRVVRDAGDVVRAVAPAVVVSLDAAPGEHVREGQQLAVLEAMKTEMPVVAPWAGRVRDVVAQPNAHVPAGAPLLVLEREADEQERPAGRRISLARERSGPATPPREQADRALEATLHLVLGFDFDDPEARRLAAERARACDALPADDAAVGERERTILGALADLLWLARRDFDAGCGAGTSPDECLRTWLAASPRSKAGLPEPFLACLRRVQARYGPGAADAGPGGDEAALRTVRALQGMERSVAHACALLERRLRLAAQGAAPPTPGYEALLGRLAADAGPYAGLRDLALALRYRAYERPRGAPVPAAAPAPDDEAAELSRAGFRSLRVREGEGARVLRLSHEKKPDDVRLLARLETSLADAGGPPDLPRLERALDDAVAALRECLWRLPREKRPVWNRIEVLATTEVLPPDDELAQAARRLRLPAPELLLERAVVTVRAPQGARELHLTSHFGEATRVEVRPPGARPLAPRDAYEDRLALARRLDVPYPHEILRMLAPAAAPEGGDFPPGEFVEHDLDDEGRLVPVSRPPGQHRANLVVGLVRNRTARHPEGMERVAILGDGTRDMGALAEPECRRLLGAFDLAERRRLPVEWFAVSAGARISMDVGTEGLDWIARVLKRLVLFTQAGGEINVVVAGVNVGGQSYFDAEATMLMHTRGILVTTPQGSMVLTGKRALDYSGGVSAEDNRGIGGPDRVMGPNGQAQYCARDLPEACRILLRHYDHAYVAPGERFPRRAPTTDPIARDVGEAPLPPGSAFARVGDLWSRDTNPARKTPFDIRAVMRAVADADHEPLERWAPMRDAEAAVVWDAHVGGIPACLVGIESRPVPRFGVAPADGPETWTGGTLFPQASRKVARAVNAASGNRPVVVLANLSGFDGSPESMRRWQLEYGAEIGRAVVNFRGPMVFCVVSRYHGGAFVVFSRALNDSLSVAAIEGSFASVIGGAPAAAVVFPREARAETLADPRVKALRERLDAAARSGQTMLQAEYDEAYDEVFESVLVEKRRLIAERFDAVHTIERAAAVGSVSEVIASARLRPWIIEALERGLAEAAPGSPDR